jgi:nitrite reductase/ring-hydroxylating ferredoxin subunit
MASRLTTIDLREPGAVKQPWLDQVRDGRIVVVKGALQQLNYLDPLKRLTLDVIEQESSPEQAKDIESRGFEALHHCLTGRQIYAVYRALTDRLVGRHNRIVLDFVRKLGGYGDRLYIGKKVWVRFFLPHDRFMENRTLFSRRFGHLRTQNPHRDSWLTNPTNAIVLWIAVGRVGQGNGMLFYPDHWQRPFDHEDFERRAFRIDAGARLGMPVTVALDPGDVLVFSGEHLHSSAINVTDETRYALSFRFTMQPPRYGEGNRWYPYLDARWLNTVFGPLAGMRSRLTPTYVRYLVLWRLGYWLRQRFWPNSAQADDNAITPSNEAPAAQKISIPKLRKGEMRPLDATRGVACTSEGVFVFPRYCPHEGADLTAGYLREGRIHCPWHNLGIDLKTGNSPCKGLARLEITRLATS